MKLRRPPGREEEEEDEGNECAAAGLTFFIKEAISESPSTQNAQRTQQQARSAHFLWAARRGNSRKGLGPPAASAKGYLSFFFIKEAISESPQTSRRGRLLQLRRNAATDLSSSTTHAAFGFVLAFGLVQASAKASPCVRVRQASKRLMRPGPKTRNRGCCSGNGRAPRPGG